MATLYKQPKSPYYFARYFDADGKRVSKSTGVSAKREAAKIAAGFEADERRERGKRGELPKQFSAIIETAAREAVTGDLTLARAEELVLRLYQYANPETEIVSLEKFWQGWIAEQRNHVGFSTATGYDQDLDLFSSMLGRKVMKSPPNELTKEQVTAALTKAKKKGDRRATTINKALASLRRVMDAAVVAKLATGNPAKQARALKAKDSIQRAPFTAQEVRAMIDHEKTTDEWRGAITIAAHTGLRMSDVFNLSRKNVDGTRLVIKPSKTSDSTGTVITVPLTPPCLAWIGDKKGDFFPTLKNKPSPVRSMQFAVIMKRAGVEKEIELPGDMKASRSFHSLRHTFASWLAEADVHADVRQKLTGHSSSKIHQRYTHHDEALERAVGTLPTL
ncbi:MAG: tyrosine-type recombinase/integrase [Akkermansiaceae bacterium]